MSLDLYQLRERLGGEVTAGGRRWLGPGPGHKPHDRSLSVTISDDGRALVHSFACDEFRRCADHIGLTRERGSPAKPTSVDRARVPAAQRLSNGRTNVGPASDDRAWVHAREIWSNARSSSFLVAEYLRNRGITLETPPTLRQGSTIIFGRTPIPTMVAAVQGPDRRLIAVQELRLTGSGKKAAITRPRHNTGKLSDGAVRLGPASTVMGIAEGVETALAAQQLHGVPVWAALGCERLAKIWLPPGLERLHIFADNDDAGQRGARQAAARWSACGVEVVVDSPDTGKDWADVAASGRV